MFDFHNFKKAFNAYRNFEEIKIKSYNGIYTLSQAGFGDIKNISFRNFVKYPNGDVCEFFVYRMGSTTAADTMMFDKLLQEIFQGNNDLELLK